MIEIPHPENPFHIDNLKTIPLLEAQGFEGSDVSLAISLFEYNGIWRLIPEKLRDHPDEDYVFVFNVGRVNRTERDQFARVGMASCDFDKEFKWITQTGWDNLMSCLGANTLTEWLQAPYPTRIYDMCNYWGWSNVFGCTVYGGAFDIRDPDHDYGSDPMPGESTDDYYARLISDESRGGEAWIPQDFVRTETGAWFASPQFGEWMCHWHNNMDKVYAVGSSVIANHEVPLEVLADAITLMERNYLDKVHRDELFDAVEAQVLIQVMTAALSAKPSTEPQQAEL